MDNADLTHAMQEMKAEMAAMRAELNSLKERANVVTPAVPQVKSVVSITRRNTLKRLGLTLLGGAVAATTLGNVPSTQAKIIANPNTNGMTNRVGMLVFPPGAPPPTNTAPGSNSYGLIACGDNIKSLSVNLVSVGNDTGVVGIGRENGLNGVGVAGFGALGVVGNGSSYGVSGKGISSGGGVYGSSESGYGVEGYSASGDGLHGSSYAGNGVSAESTQGAPFRIKASLVPSAGTRALGDMYVDTSGNLHIWNGAQWKTVLSS
jgi:hypothetical protein